MNLRDVPNGSEFLETIGVVEGRCVAESLAGIPTLGISAPFSYECLGNVLSLLYREASCQFGCPGGDHFIQRITARVVSLSLAALRLALSGYYDEALSLIRSVGEVEGGPLSFLFAAQPAVQEEWRAADEFARKREFAPVKIRLKLEALGLTPPVGAALSRLSEVGAHIVPSLAPQAFNEHGHSTLGARFQLEGLMVVLNELGTVVAEAAGCVSVLLPADDRRVTLQTEAEMLLNVLGDLDLAKSRDRSPWRLTRLAAVGGLHDNEPPRLKPGVRLPEATECQSLSHFSPGYSVVLAPCCCGSLLSGRGCRVAPSRKCCRPKCLGIFEYLVAASMLAKTNKIPGDFSVGTAVFVSLTDRIGDLPPHLVGEVVFLYRYFEELNRMPSSFGESLRELRATSQPPRTTRHANANWRQQSAFSSIRPS